MKFLVCVALLVLLVDSIEIGRSSMKNTLFKRSMPGDIYDGFKEYNYCYEYFSRLYADNMGTYHGVCHARDKLKLCKDRVIAKYPKIAITAGYQQVSEVQADFWCTYNTTHHRPADPFYTMDAMYLKYVTCPYVHALMVTHEDHSTQIRLALHRTALANSILQTTGADGLSKWQGNHEYSDPHDPVHKALSAYYCDMYKHETYQTDNIMSKYCVIVKDINTDLYDVCYTYLRHTEGLHNWNTSLCIEYEDALEQVMRISQLDKWLSNQKKPGLTPCHDHNVYIEGATCLIMFHTRLPPYSDLHNIMPAFVKNIAELNSCWDRVTSECPQPSSASRNISLVIEIYNLVSDISKEDAAQVWDVIWSWSDLYKKSEYAQVILQALYQLLAPRVGLTATSFPLMFGSSLEAALSDHKSPISHNITALFSNLSSALYKISAVGNDNYQGVNIFEGFHDLNKYVLYLLSPCFQSLYELFVEVGEFVQYTGRCPEWWTYPCQ